MVTPELRKLSSPDLDRPAIPADPADCSVALEASIGPKGEKGEELFQFQVVTPRALARASLPRWGRGLLIVEEFSWASVERVLERLLAHARRDTWAEVAGALNHQLQSEYDNYRPYAD
jgi:immunity protein 8 of polymorphic toxin system